MEQFKEVRAKLEAVVHGGRPPKEAEPIVREMDHLNSPMDEKRDQRIEAHQVEGGILQAQSMMWALMSSTEPRQELCDLLDKSGRSPARVRWLKSKMVSASRECAFSFFHSARLLLVSSW